MPRPSLKSSSTRPTPAPPSAQISLSSTNRSTTRLPPRASPSSTGESRYELRAITKEGIRLKATIKAIKNQGDRQRFHLDTVDLYSNSRRLSYAKAAATLFSEKEETIVEDMAGLIDLAEAWQPDKTEGEPHAALSPSDEQEALDFLKSPDLFDRILADFETIGLTGEDANKLMGYLAATSRKLDDPLSCSSSPDRPPANRPSRTPSSP